MPHHTTGNWLRHAEWAPALLTDHQFTRHFPFVSPSPGSRLREESIRRFRRLGAPFFYFKNRLLVHIWPFVHHSYIFLFATDSHKSVQTTWEHACVSENICLYPEYIFEGPYIQNHLSSGQIATVKTSSKTLTSRIRPQERSTLQIKTWFTDISNSYVLTSSQFPLGSFALACAAQIPFYCYVSILFPTLRLSFTFDLSFTSSDELPLFDLMGSHHPAVSCTCHYILAVRGLSVEAGNKETWIWRIRD